MHASHVTDSGDKKCDLLTDEQRKLYDAADRAPKIDYPQEVINLILDLISAKLGISDP
jgi:hypothetical protein